MRTLPGYTLGGPIAATHHTCLCHGVRLSDARSVLLRVPLAEDPVRGREEIRHEAAMAGSFGGLAVLRPVDLVETAGMTALAYLDSGVRPFVPTDDPRRSLRAAVLAARALDNLHRRGVAHLALGPGALLFDGELTTAWITALGSAVRLEGGEVPAAAIDHLPWLAPEQTGRVAWPIDQRADLYVLGLLLFDWLASELPFHAPDCQGLVHQHIALEPPGLVSLVDGLPPMVDRVVRCALAKDPAARYQTAFGLRADLGRCLAEWQQTGAVAPFDPMERDLTLRFPRELFGRDDSLGAANRVLGQVFAGRSVAVFVTGPGGIGKSSLVEQVLEDAGASAARIVRGCCDPCRTHVPFDVLVRAITDLVHQLLALPESQLSRIRQRVDLALGANQAVLAGALPELELLLGRQAPVVDLPPENVRIRIRTAFAGFVRACATAGDPLVIFLDDLQWSDVATIELLGSLFEGADCAHLAFVGAWRDAELEPASPRARLAAGLRGEGVEVLELALGPLGVRDTGRLLEGSLRQPVDRAGELATVLHRRSAGSPLLVRELLRRWVADDRLVYDRAARLWTWDSASIARTGPVDDARSFLAGSLSQLPEGTRRALRVAACLGSSFDLGLLGKALEEPIDVVVGHLRPALEAGLVDYRGDLPVAAVAAHDATAAGKAAPFLASFVDDRVHEAALALHPGTGFEEVHLRIGRLLASGPEEVPDSLLFDAVHHLDAAVVLITDPEERAALALLNLRAGRKALSTAAFEAARRYLDAGLSLLDDDCWTRTPDLALALHLRGAEAQHATGNVERSEQLVDEVIRNVADPVRQAGAWRLRIHLLSNAFRLRDAVSAGLDILTRLGIDIPRNVARPELVAAVQEVVGRLATLDRDLADLSESSDPRVRAASEVIADIIPASFMAWPELNGRIVVEGMKLLLDEGVVPAHAVTCTPFGILLCAFGDIEQGYRMGEAGVRLQARFPDDPIASVSVLQFPVFIQHYREPIRSTLPGLERAAGLALSLGNVPNYGYCLNQRYSGAVMAGLPLAGLDQEYEALHGHLMGNGQVLAAMNVALFGQFVANLRGAAGDPAVVDGDRFDAGEMMPVLDQAAYGFQAFHVHVCRLWLAVLLGRWADALVPMRAARGLAPAALNVFAQALLHTFGSLVLMRAARLADSDEEREALLAEAAPHREQVALLARHGPANHAHRALLVAAEASVLEGDPALAARQFEQAGDLARQAGFVHDAGLALELAAEAHLSARQSDRARGCLERAVGHYEAWGAAVKVADVRSRHPDLGAAAGPADMASAGSLDLATVIQVSEVVTGELRTEDLVTRLMRLVIENAGAERGLLLLAQDGDLRVVATGTVAGGVDLLAPIPVADWPDVASSVVRFGKRTRSTVVLSDARAPGVFVADPYVRRVRPRSLLCAPVEHRHRLVGVIYLENNLFEGAFDASRVDLVRLIASLAATSVENARLYTNLSEATAALRESHARLKAYSRSLEDAVRERTGELDELNRKYQLIFNSVSEGICGVDADRRVSFVNPAASKLTGQPTGAILGRPVESVLGVGTGDDAPLCDSNASPVQVELVRPDGTRSWVEASCHPIQDDEGRVHGSVVSFRDVTERRRLEQQLAHSQKMEAVGRFAGGVAHDFNNLLTPILVGAEQLAGAGSVGSVQVRVAESILRAGSRAAELVRQMLAFGRRTELFMQPTDLRDVMHDVVDFLHRTLDRSITVQLEVPPDLPWIRGDSGQMHQVLLNLCTNAQDALQSAIPLVVCPSIVIEAQPVEVAADAIPEDSHARPGSYVELAVHDNGPGMPPEVMERLFEPFFTTKPLGQGSGLGLAVVYGIVNGHGGWVRCQSTEAGTSFSCYLPVLVASEPATLSEPGPGEKLRSGPARILVVDDEELIRDLADLFLRQFGYEVLLAADGREAVEIYKKAHHEVDLVLLDLSMPVMSGRETLIELLGINPRVRVILWSGYAPSDEVDSVRQIGAKAFIAKPFKMADLAKVVERVLGPEI